MPRQANAVSVARRHQILVAMAATALLSLPIFLLPPPIGVLASVAIALAPVAIIFVFNCPFLLCLAFVAFSFFRIHEAFPVLNPLRIPVLLAIPTLAVLFWHTFLSREIKPYWSKELKTFAIFFALVTIGLPFAESKPTAFAYWTATYWKIAIMVVAIAWLVRKPSDFEFAARAFISGSILISLVAISNKLNGIGLVEGTRVTISRDMGSVLGDPNDLSLILLFPLGFAASLATAKTGWFNRLYGATACVLIVWAIICTQSRGGLLGILAVFGVVGLRVVKSKVVLISIGAFAAIALMAAMGLKDRASGGAQEEGIDESAMGRIHAWNAAWKMATARPLNGVGLDNFVSNYYFYSDHWDGLNHAVHSTWFNVLSETGFPGFFTFVYMIWVIGSSSYRSMIRLGEARAPPVVQAMALALVAGVTGFCIAGTFLTQGFTWPVYVLLALCSATARYVAVNHPVAADVKSSAQQ